MTILKYLSVRFLQQLLLGNFKFRIEDLFLRPAVKKAIILLLSRGHIKVLKDALAHLGPYQTLMSASYSDPGGENTVPLPATIQI